MQITIKKAEIRGSIFLSYEFEQTDVNVKNNIKTSSDAPIHDDLRTAFRKLIPHFAFICEEITDQEAIKMAILNHEHYLGDKDKSPDERFFKYRVFGFSLKDNKGLQLLELKGAKRLENNEEISFSTFEIDIDDPDYVFHTNLVNAIEELKEEVLAYMQGKCAPKAQQELFGEGDDEE